MWFQNRCQIECQRECQNIGQIECQIECQDIWYMSDRMPNRAPGRMSEYISDRMSKYMPDRMSVRMSECLPGRMTDRMSEYMPDWMAEYMSDKMPWLGSHEGTCFFMFHFYATSHGFWWFLTFGVLAPARPSWPPRCCQCWRVHLSQRDRISATDQERSLERSLEVIGKRMAICSRGWVILTSQIMCSVMSHAQRHSFDSYFYSSSPVPPFGMHPSTVQ